MVDRHPDDSGDADAGRGGPAAPAHDRPQFRPPALLAVETFLTDIAENVAGDRLAVDALMPIGVDPHAFEPTPQDVARIAKSQVLITNGAGFETWLSKVLDNAGGRRLVVEAAAGLSSRAGARRARS